MTLFRSLPSIREGVGMLFLGEFAEDVLWKDHEVRENRFIFIGKHLDHDFFRTGFMACVVPEEGSIVLRFPVGTLVEVH